MINLFKWISFVSFIFRFRFGLLPQNNRGAMLAEKLKSMGVLFVKVGQIMSVQYNYLDVKTRAALQCLQDQNNGEDYRDFFVDGVEVERTPFACGSIAHLYKGVYQGKPVAVKVLRQNVQEDFVSTRAVLQTVARVLSWCPGHVAKWGVNKFIVIVIDILETQLNFKNELENWRAMHDKFKGSNIVIPLMYEELCTETVLVMDYIDAFSIYDMKKLPYEVIKEKAEQLVKVFFHGLFKEGIIHADCHAGNIFWTKPDMQLGFFDFGIVQTISPETSKTFLKFYGNMFAGDIDTALLVLMHNFVEGFNEDTHAKSILGLQKLFHARLSKGVDNVNVIQDMQTIFAGSKDISLRHDFTITNITFLNIDGILETMAHRFDILTIVKSLIKDMIMNNEIDLCDLN